VGRTSPFSPPAAGLDLSAVRPRRLAGGQAPHRGFRPVRLGPTVLDYDVEILEVRLPPRSAAPGSMNGINAPADWSESLLCKQEAGRQQPASVFCSGSVSLEVLDLPGVKINDS
jgi:hypothetical protein